MELYKLQTNHSHGSATSQPQKNNLVHNGNKRINQTISVHGEIKERNRKRTNLARSIGSVSGHRSSHVSSESSVSSFSLKNLRILVYGPVCGVLGVLWLLQGEVQVTKQQKRASWIGLSRYEHRGADFGRCGAGQSITSPEIWAECSNIWADQCRRAITYPGAH